MGNKLYVGNLSFNTTEIELQDLFAQAGTVSEVMLVQDRFTGKSRGFAFVTMSSEEEAKKAIELFHSKPFDGRPLTVNEAQPREERRGGGGGGGRREYGGGGGYRGGGGGGGGGTAVVVAIAAADAAVASAVTERRVHLISASAARVFRAALRS